MNNNATEQGVFNFFFFVRWAKIIHIENQYFTKKITNTPHKMRQSQQYYLI